MNQRIKELLEHVGGNGAGTTGFAASVPRKLRKNNSN